MPQCAVLTCGNSHRRTKNSKNKKNKNDNKSENNKSDDKSETIRYHRFPRHPQVRHLWIVACGRTHVQNKAFNIDTARVCSAHFPEDFYEDESQEQIMLGNLKKDRLKFGAVPTKAVMFKVDPCFNVNLNANGGKRRAAARLRTSNPKVPKLGELHKSAIGNDDQGPKNAQEKETTKSESVTKNNEEENEEAKKRSNIAVQIQKSEAEDKIISYKAVMAQRRFMMHLKLMPTESSQEW